MKKQEFLMIIHDLAKRKVLEHEKYHNNLELEYQRKIKRGTNLTQKEVHIPEIWSIDKKFNPYYVLKKYKQIGNAIFNKLITNTYKPNDPFVHSVEKEGSSTKRDVYIYQIPDEAVSKYFYERLLRKNKHRFSSFSYAYRNDRNVHFAVVDIALDFKSNPRTFIAEFDFKDFFGSIDHRYLIKQFDNNGFLISDFERNVITNFLSSMDNSVGIPQGTSLSLFLANLVCWELDKNLEKEGLRFARYADDTIIWSASYDKITKTLDIMNDFSKKAGVEINLLKSKGISSLSSKGLTSELNSSVEFVEFLGYKISTDTISIKNASLIKIKNQIASILYENLIQPLNKDKLISVRIPSDNRDLDFNTAILQIRRYLYGNLNEEMLRNYISGSNKRLKFKGLMSFYPLLEDEDQLKDLDKWMLSTIMNSVKKRNELLIKHGQDRSNQFPFNHSGEQLLLESKKKGFIEIPSFLRIYQVLKLNIKSAGIEETMNPKSNRYNY